MSDENKKCGTRSGYVLGCRCPQCVAANRDYLARYRKGKKMSDGNSGQQSAASGQPGEPAKPATSAELAAGTKGAEAAKAKVQRQKEKAGDDPPPPKTPDTQQRVPTKSKNALATFWGM